MKLVVILTTLATIALTNPINTLAARDIDPNLVPDFGVQAGVPDGNGNCQGANGVAIPCNCPPDRDAFISQLSMYVDAGNAYGSPVSFPTGNSSDDCTTRINAAIVTLQNLSGPGFGCPVLGSAPNFVTAQQEC